MVLHTQIDRADLIAQIRCKEITLGGNRKLKIYGTLHCRSGKRMKKENRVFFRDAREAAQLVYRPCGHCMRSAYQNWKNGSVQ